jgi:outer membrane protein TolC
MMPWSFNMKEIPVNSIPRRACLGLSLVVTCLAVTRHSAAQPAAVAPPAAGDTLSVAECVALARRVAPEVRALASDAEAARLDSAATSLNGRPAYSVFGGATLAPRGFYDPAATNLGEYELKAGIALPLRDGGERRRDRMSAALARGNATIEAARASRDAGLRAAGIALDAVRAHEQAEALRETLAWLEQLEVLVGSGVRAGSRERSDADRVAIERDAVRFDLETLDQARAERVRELAALLGRAPGAPLEFRDPVPADAAAPVAADSVALFERTARSPEALAARVAESQAQLALDAARHRNAVAVDLTADAGAWGTDLSHVVPPDLAAEHPGATFGDRLRRDLGASVALRFQRPLLDASSGYSIAARERQVEAARTRAANAAAEGDRRALDLLARWRGAARRLELAESASARAEDHLLHLRSLYAAGAASLLEVLDARRQLDDARGRGADARLEVRLARWEQELP